MCHPRYLGQLSQQKCVRLFPHPNPSTTSRCDYPSAQTIRDGAHGSEPSSPGPAQLPRRSVQACLVRHRVALRPLPHTVSFLGFHVCERARTVRQSGQSRSPCPTLVRRNERSKVPSAQCFSPPSGLTSSAGSMIPGHRSSDCPCHRRRSALPWR